MDGIRQYESSIVAPRGGRAVEAVRAKRLRPDVVEFLLLDYVDGRYAEFEAVVARGLAPARLRPGANGRG